MVIIMVMMMIILSLNQVFSLQIEMLIVIFQKNKIYEVQY